MNHGLHDLARHNAWATQELISACTQIDPALLNATVLGSYGSILETLQHIIDAEASYCWRLTGAWPSHPWPGNDSVGLDILAQRSATLASTLESFLAGNWNSEELGEARGDEGEVFAVRKGIFLTQWLHHSNEHRAHVCTILGANGIGPPEVSAWGYAEATGRSWLK